MMDRDERGRFVAQEGFMQLAVYADGCYVVETSDGTFYVPESVCGTLTIGLNDDGTPDDATCEAVSDYIDSPDPVIFGIERRAGYVGRYSAAGYLDCTDWSFDTNRRRLERELRDMYG